MGVKSRTGPDIAGTAGSTSEEPPFLAATNDQLQRVPAGPDLAASIHCVRRNARDTTGLRMREWLSECTAWTARRCTDVVDTHRSLVSRDRHVCDRFGWSSTLGNAAVIAKHKQFAKDIGVVQKVHWPQRMCNLFSRLRARPFDLRVP